MAKEQTPTTKSISGHDLVCPVCKNDKFFERETLMNTPGMTFIGLEWANKRAQNAICSSCGYVFWFLPQNK